MTIDFLNFTPLSAAASGALIGLAAAIFILAHGRIMGVSGILGGLVRPLKGDWGWRIRVFAGLISAPLLARAAGILPEARIDASVLILVIAGLLVGFGTSLGSGCTSGHGVCGIARLSPRSIAATLIFMVFGMATVWAMRVMGWAP